MTIQQILTKHWGYTSFRPMQEDIINSILDNKDTLALLPTGGGKSICFQVPALLKEGVCIVVSPLIALMKDQVANLRKREINAVAIYSGMSNREIDVTLDNCIYGNVKFIYLSPERLHSELVQERIKKMNVSFIVVDEAHCISQWGYDFRPSYLSIKEIREILPKIPILALTATATPEVVVDIQEKLGFKEENVLQNSFERRNLTYYVINEEDKVGRLIRIIDKIHGSGIVYVRSRKRTKEISEFLSQNGISSDYYHAGVDMYSRGIKQENWVNNKTRVIVSTNAFGMGIDKPDVRFVVHIDLPDSLEAYFQEAGRAGRDEKVAHAILLYNNTDEIDLKKRYENGFPSIEEVKRTYQALANYYQLAIGSGEGQSFELDINGFCHTYNIPVITAFNSLKILEREGYLITTDAVFIPSRIHIEVDKDTLYTLQVRNRHLDKFIKLLLRSYGGLFDGFVNINEQYLATHSKVEIGVVRKVLTKLHVNKVLSYIPQTNSPQVIYTAPRSDVKNLFISKVNLLDRKKAFKKRMQAVLNYASSHNKCRSQQLLAYFGEKEVKRCGKCDVCLERNKLEISKIKFDQILDNIKEILKESPSRINEIVFKIHDEPEEEVLKVIQWLLDNDKIYHDEDKRLKWMDKLFR